MVYIGSFLKHLMLLFKVFPLCKLFVIVFLLPTYLQLVIGNQISLHHFLGGGFTIVSCTQNSLFPFDTCISYLFCPLPLFLLLVFRKAVPPTVLLPDLILRCCDIPTSHLYACDVILCSFGLRRSDRWWFGLEFVPHLPHPL